MNYFLTKEKKEELEIELKGLISDGRKDISQRLDEAKALGDLKENAEYHQAREDQGKMEARIEEIEVMLRNSEIIKYQQNGEVQIGAKVKILKDKKELEYLIVGRAEVDILNNKIAIDSPLAQSMIGKKKGEEFIFETPNGKKHQYKIVSIL